MSRRTGLERIRHRAAPALLAAAILLLAIAEAHGLVITVVRAQLLDGIPWQAALAAHWPQRLSLLPVILVAAAIGLRSRPLAFIAAAVALTMAVACFIVPVDLPYESSPWVRFDDARWPELPLPVEPGGVAAARGVGVGIAGVAAAVVAVAPRSPWSPRAATILLVAAALTLAGALLHVDAAWLDAVHTLLVLLGVLLLTGRRPALGATVLGVVGLTIAVLIGWEATLVTAATGRELPSLAPIVGAAYAGALVLGAMLPEREAARVAS